MKKYFYSDGENHYGPFSVEELKSHNINKSTMVWMEGWTDWKEAKEETELKSLFLTPPPVKKANIPPSFIKNEDVEKTYYTNQSGIRITSSRLIIGDSTYPVSGVTAVHAYTNSSSSYAWLVIALLGLFLVLFAGLLGVFITIVSIVLFLKFGKQYNYSLQIQTLAGSIDVLQSQNKTLIQEISAAINNAIIDRG